MRITLIRHGQMTGDPFETPSRPVSGCLSEVGIGQAEDIARALARKRFDIAFSSPFGRALQTAEIVLRGRDTPIHVFDFLKEWLPDPALSELPSTEYEQIAKRNAERYAEETWKTELGEGCYDMHARIIPPFLEELAKVGFRHRMGGYVPEARAQEFSLAVFAHGGTLNVLLAFLIGAPPFPVGRFSFELTGVAEITFTGRQGIYYPALVVPAPRPPQEWDE